MKLHKWSVLNPVCYYVVGALGGEVLLGLMHNAAGLTCESLEADITLLGL